MSRWAWACIRLRGPCDQDLKPIPKEYLHAEMCCMCMILLDYVTMEGQRAAMSAKAYLDFDRKSLHKK